MRFLADENLDRRVAVRLRRAGHDITSAPKGLADKAAAELAKAQARVLLTHDEDFADSRTPVRAGPPRRLRSSKNSKEVAVKKNAMSLPYAGDTLSEAIRLRIRDAITQIADEELNATLGAGSYERTESRRGYRHGSEARTLTTGMARRLSTCRERNSLPATESWKDGSRR